MEKIIQEIENKKTEVQSFATTSIEELENFKNKFLSKKNGFITNLFAELKNYSLEEKKILGQKINELKDLVEEKITKIKENIESAKWGNKDIDITLPGEIITIGKKHPVSQIISEIIEIFEKIGFITIETPEIEDDWHNFSALNFPKEHPARDMQDTFFIGQNELLRTHTSNGQIRYMETHQPPIKIVIPGRTYRNEDISARAHFMFHQIEGLYVDENVSFIDLRQTLLHFAREFFGHSSQVRMRPSYFPFTEPSAEVDVTCSICGGKGCNVCKYSGWLEILGCGMVHPNVLENCGIDSKKYSGFAFGMGIERLAMLRYGVKDIRYFFENDLRFLNQF